MLLRSTVDENIRKQKLQGIKCWLLDMDGTVSMGEELLNDADKFFEALTHQRFIFVTNNSSHSAAHYIKRMNMIGITTKRENVLTSTDALIMYIKKMFSDNNIKIDINSETETCTSIDTITETKSYTSANTITETNSINNGNTANNKNSNPPKQRGTIRVFPVGTPDFEMELIDAGIEVVKEREKQINAVLLAFDTTLTYAKLDNACDYIRSGVPYFVANPDKVCPLADGKVLPDCGSILAFIETCTGVPPAKIIGKPDTAMAEMIISKYGYKVDELAMVGDRIYTDLAFAKNAGITSVAVLTGEATLEEINDSNVEPEFIFEKISDIVKYLKG